MKPTFKQPQTSITAEQAKIAAGVTGDWRQRKFQRRRIREYGALTRKFLKSLGAQITTVTN